MSGAGGADKDDLLRSALDLAGRGFKVFPLNPCTGPDCGCDPKKPVCKRPAVSGWQEKATTDEAVIRRVWAQDAFNIGVKTGDGLLVADIDVKAGKQGAESWAALGLSDEDQDTFTVSTPSGGWHVYYAGDGANSSGRLGAGIDTRGLGGYVVGPGSALTNGSGQGSYDILHRGSIRRAPVTVVGRLEGVLRTASASGPDRQLDRDDAGSILRTTEYLKRAPIEGTYQVAARIKDFGVSEPMAVALLEEHWNGRRVVPHTLDMLQEKVAHAYRYGLNSPGVDHPVAVFGDVRIEPVPEPVKVASKWFRHGDAWDKNTAWMLYETLPQVGTVVIVGPTNSGKTFLEIELARSLATGKAFFGVQPDVRGGTAFLFAGTEGSGLPLRLEALGESERLPISATSVADLSGRGALTALLEALREEAAYHQMMFDVPLRLVVLETLSASGLVNDENNNAELSRAMTNLGTIARELGVLFVTSHHPPKHGDGARGGGAITASADFVMEIRRDGTDSLRRLDLTKARNAEQRALGSFTLLKVELGKDAKNRPITSMVISMGEAVRTSATYSAFTETFMQALEFEIIDNGEMVEGQKSVEYGAVRGRFKELKTGSKDKANVNAAFKRAFEVAESMGVIGSAVFDGDRFLWKKDITND